MSFDLSGGAPCLDFANTLEDRAGQERDLLSGYGDLVDWSRESGLIAPGTATALKREADRHPGLAARVLDSAIELREAVFRLFSATAAGLPPRQEELDTLNGVLARAMSRLEVVAGSEGLTWDWRADDTSLDRVVWPVARSAAEILTGKESGRVRECASATCRWLFLDRSRNRSRRWCDMQTCGNRHKARRHYARKKSAV